MANEQYISKPIQKTKALWQVPATINHSLNASIPNSAVLGMYSEMDGQEMSPDSNDLAQKMQQRLCGITAKTQAQIPAAEQEADRLSSDVLTGSPEAVKAAMGQKLGANFSSVRFHTNESDAAKAEAMGARAYATGQDIYFTQGFEPRVAAHELVHTVQQGTVPSDTATITAPAGSVQMWPWTKKKEPSQPATAPSHIPVQAHSIDASGFKFNKRAYATDRKYKNLQGLITSYNQDNSAENEAALMNAAMGYVDKYSTGKKGSHKGRTARAEDIIYQLSMKGNTQQKAVDQIDRMASNIGGFDSKTGATPEEIQRGKDTLDVFRNASAGTGGFSPAMQMIVANVMANQSKTHFRSAMVSNSEKSWTPNRSDHSYEVWGRTGNNLQDAAGTTLHEMTHVSAGESYGNTSALVTAHKDASPQELRALRDERVKRFKGLRETVPEQLSAEPGARSGEYGATFVDQRSSYALNDKTLGTYIPKIKGKLLQEQALARGQQVPERAEAQERAKRGELDQELIISASRGDRRGIGQQHLDSMIEDAEGLNSVSLAFQGDLRNGKKSNADTLIEYEPVINQMLVEYEMQTDDRNSEHYRKLKAAALRAHVQRHNAKLGQR